MSGWLATRMSSLPAAFLTTHPPFFNACAHFLKLLINDFAAAAAEAHRRHINSRRAAMPAKPRTTFCTHIIFAKRNELRVSEKL
jgi:hypothetical protein